MSETRTRAEAAAPRQDSKDLISLVIGGLWPAEASLESLLDRIVLIMLSDSFAKVVCEGKIGVEPDDPETMLFTLTITFTLLLLLRVVA